MTKLKWAGVVCLVLAAAAAAFWLTGRHMLLVAFVRNKVTREAMPHAYVVPQPLALPKPRGEPISWGRVSLLSPWGAPVAQKGNDKAVKFDFFGGRSLALLPPSQHAEFTLSGMKPKEQEAIRMFWGADITDQDFYRTVLEATPDRLRYFAGVKETTAVSVLCLLKAIGMMGPVTSIGSFETAQGRGYLYKIPSRNLARLAVFDQGGVFHDVLVQGPASDEELGALAASLSFN